MIEEVSLNDNTHHIGHHSSNSSNNFKAKSCYTLVDDASLLLTYPIFCSLVYHRYLIILQQYKQYGYIVYTVDRECMKIL